jgi:hypothetical protein
MTVVLLTVLSVIGLSNYGIYKIGEFDMKKVLAFIIVLSFVIGCSDTAVSPKLKATVASDRTSDSVDWNVVITERNESSRNVYFTQRSDCIGFWRLERKLGDAWVEVDRATVSYSTVYPDGRTMIRPGEVLRDSFMLAQAGTYRIGFPYAWDESEPKLDSLAPEEFIAK